MLPIEKSDYFLQDFDAAFEWYAVQAGEKIALRYVPGSRIHASACLGMPGHRPQVQVQASLIAGIALLSGSAPFGKYLLFYRHDEKALHAERMMHGSRDLPRRLRESP